MRNYPRNRPRLPASIGARGLCYNLPARAPVAQRIERWPAEPKVGGSSPLGRATPHPVQGFATSPALKPEEKANAHPLREAVEAFLLTKQVAGCTSATIATYRWWLQCFTAAVVDVTPITVRQFFAGLQHRSASHQHQAFRTLRTFFRWCIETGALSENPLRGFTMRTPKTLPTVPTDDELRAVLTACPATLEGTRNRALILVFADSALRASEVLRLLIE